MEITAQDVLVVIDVQNDFCPGGVLAVADGDAVIDVIHRVAPSFEHMILTQDWHPAGHSSFASAHPGKQPFQQIELSYGTQTLWPDHCVQGSKGAEFHPSLHLPRAQLILRKGFRPQIDSYSAFFENDRVTPTGLAGYLRLPAVILRDACRAIDLNSSVARIEAQFSQAGVTLIESAEVGAQDAKGNQRSLDIAARADVEEGIRQGLEDARKGMTRPAWEFFDEFEASHPDLE